MKKLLLAMALVAGVFTLAACGGETEEPANQDLELVEDARDSLLLSGLDSVTSNLNLPSSGRNDSTITWSSSDPSVIANDGTVTRPAEGEDNVTVTLTATLTLNDESVTRSFEAFVLAFEPSNLFTDYTELYEASNINDLITAEGVVSSVFDGGFFVYDGAEHLGVYIGSGGTGGGLVELGDEVRVTGLYARYYTLYQLGDVENVEVLSSGNSVDAEATPITIEEWNALTLDDPLIHGDFYEVTGTLVQQGEFNNLFLTSSESDDEILVYYYSDADSLEALEAFIGRTITLELVYYTNHASNGIMASYYGDGTDVVVAELTDAQKLELDTEVLEGMSFVTYGDAVELPATGSNGTTFSNWASGDADLVGDDGSYGTTPATPTDITFTATATLGDETSEVEITVQSLAEISIEDALEVDPGGFVWFSGKVVDIIDGNSGFFLYDETGIIYVRDTDFYDENADAVEMGDSWTFVGARTDYRGLPQVASIDFFEASDETFADEPDPTYATVQDIVEGNVVPGQKYLVYGTATTVEEQYTNYELQDGDFAIQLHFQTNNSAIADYDGQEVILEVRPFQWDNDPSYVAYFGTADDVDADISDDEKAEVAAKALRLPFDENGDGVSETVYTDVTLPATGKFDLDLSWSSSATGSLANDGAVTLGAEAVDVVLTLTVGTVTREFTVEVGPEPMDVSSALLAPDGDTILVEGVVVSLDPHTNGFFIQDADGTGIYVGDFGDDELKSQVAVGDKVWVLGTRDGYTQYGNMQDQVWEAEFIAKASEDNEVFVTKDMTGDQIIADFPNANSRRFEATLTVDEYDQYSHVFFETTDESLEMRLTFDIRNVEGWDEDTYPVGTEITIAFTTQRIHFDNYRVVDVVIVQGAE